MSEQFDAIVVGSGISGGWAAKELTEKGLKVLMLERGAPLEHSVDYIGEHAPPWNVPYQGKPLRELYKEEYEISGTSYAFSELNRHFWNNDKQNPYDYNPEKPFEWVRADVVGGRSLLWGRQSYRWSEMDFQANAKDGHGIPWPIGYDDIAPWYSYVEKFAGISGRKEGLAQLPDGEFQKPMDFYALEQTFKDRMESKMKDRIMTIGRVAVLTEDLPGRAACHYCGPCHNGCSTGSYFSTQSSTLPAARATGNLTLKANAVVERLVHDPATGKVSAVEVIDSQTMERTRYSAKIFFLCASTVGSTQILMHSKSEAFPNGMANGSGALGHYMMDHQYRAGGIGAYVDHMDKYHYGNRPNGTYIPRYRNLPGNEGEVDFIRGYGYQGMALRMSWTMPLSKKGFGADYKNSLRQPGLWIMALTGFGECLPYESNRMVLHPTKVDRFGIPQVSFEFEWGDNEKSMRKDMIEQASKMHKAAGAVFDFPMDSPSYGGSAIHEMGTARMGDDPNDSVLNKHNQAHEVSNLFVTDGSCMTSASCVNPSLTYMALTARAADYAVTRLAEGTI